jgi:hypothetical protein
MANTANPSTQPIYPNNPLVWHRALTTQVNGFNPMANTTVNPPVLLGRASESGALLEHLSTFSMYSAPVAGSGGSSGGGGTAADGAFGTGTVADPLALRFYSRRKGTTELVSILELALNPASRFNAFRWAFFPIIPDPQVGLRLAAGEELYVALSKAVPGAGINISVRGGHYSLDGEDYFGA